MRSRCGPGAVSVRFRCGFGVVLVLRHYLQSHIFEKIILAINFIIDVAVSLIISINQMNIEWKFLVE